MNRDKFSIKRGFNFKKQIQSKNKIVPIQNWDGGQNNQSTLKNIIPFMKYLGIFPA